MRVEELPLYTEREAKENLMAAKAAAKAAATATCDCCGCAIDPRQLVDELCPSCLEGMVE